MASAPGAPEAGRDYHTPPTSANAALPAPANDAAAQMIAVEGTIARAQAALAAMGAAFAAGTANGDAKMASTELSPEHTELLKKILAATRGTSSDGVTPPK